MIIGAIASRLLSGFSPLLNGIFQIRKIPHEPAPKEISKMNHIREKETTVIYRNKKQDNISKSQKGISIPNSRIRVRKRAYVVGNRSIFLKLTGLNRKLIT